MDLARWAIRNLAPGPIGATVLITNTADTCRTLVKTQGAAVRHGTIKGSNPCLIAAINRCGVLSTDGLEALAAASGALRDDTA